MNAAKLWFYPLIPPATVLTWPASDVPKVPANPRRQQKTPKCNISPGAFRQPCLLRRLQVVTSPSSNSDLDSALTSDRSDKFHQSESADGRGSCPSPRKKAGNSVPKQGKTELGSDCSTWVRLSEGAMGKKEKKVAVASAAPQKGLLPRSRSVSIRWGFFGRECVCAI